MGEGSDYALAADNEKPKLEESQKDWHTVSVQRWLKMQPPLKDVDLRDYFWLARDRTNATQHNVIMVSPLVNRLLGQLTGDNEGEHGIAARTVKELDDAERDSLLQQLHRQVVRVPEHRANSNALYVLARESVPGASRTLLDALRDAPSASIHESIAFRLKTLAKGDAVISDEVKELLTIFSKLPKSRLAIAARKALEMS